MKLILALLSVVWCVGCTNLFDHLPAEDRLRLETFELYWQAIDERYPYLGRLDADWSELHDKYQVSIALAEGPSDFYHVLAGLLSELDDPHVSLRIPDENWRVDGVAATSLAQLTPGLKVRRWGRKAYVERWPVGHEPFVPANLTGPDARYPEIVRIEGFPFAVPLNSIMYRGPPGSPVDLELRWSDGQRTHHTLHRPERSGSAPGSTKGKPKKKLDQAESAAKAGAKLRPGILTLNEVKLEGTDKQIAWIKLKSLSPRRLGVATSEAFVAEWNRVLAKALTSDGIILDLQGNGGGAMTLAMCVAHCFLAEPAQIYTQQRTQHSLLGPLLTFTNTLFHETIWRPRSDVEHRPLVVLVNADTASAAEHLARVLQSHAGALVVGAPTLGVDAGIEVVEGPDGSTLKFGSKSVLSTRGKSFQDVGVLPDISIKMDVSDLRRLGFSAWLSEVKKVHKREVRRAFKYLWQRQSGSTAQPTGNKGG